MRTILALLFPAPLIRWLKLVELWFTYPYIFFVVRNAVRLGDEDGLRTMLKAAAAMNFGPYMHAVGVPTLRDFTLLYVSRVIRILMLMSRWRIKYCNPCACNVCRDYERVKRRNQYIPLRAIMWSHANARAIQAPRQQ